MKNDTATLEEMWAGPPSAAIRSASGGKTSRSGTPFHVHMQEEMHARLSAEHEAKDPSLLEDPKISRSARHLMDGRIPHGGLDTPWTILMNWERPYGSNLQERSRNDPHDRHPMQSPTPHAVAATLNPRRKEIEMSGPTGGPKTEEGKERARWNAARHGIRSPAPVVPGIESQEDWEAHGAGVLESLKPEGHLETVLAERVALLSWRLNRVTRYETESIALYQEKAEEDLTRERRFGNHRLGEEHPQDVRGNLKAAQSTYRTFKKLPGLPDDKHLSGGDAAGLLWGVSAYLEDEDLEKTEPPSGVPDWAGLQGDTTEWEGWTSGLVREYVVSIASQAGEAPEELLEAATEKARLDVIGAKQAAKRVEQDLERMSRERLLPDDKTLEKVARYEAHLSRQLYKAMHELEALQTRRLGGAAPLARLDVDGSAES